MKPALVMLLAILSVVGAVERRELARSKPARPRAENSFREITVEAQEGWTAWILPDPYVVAERPLVVGDVDADGAEDVLLRVVKSRMCGNAPGDPRLLVVSGRTGETLLVLGNEEQLKLLAVDSSSTSGGVWLVVARQGKLRFGGPRDLLSMLTSDSEWGARDYRSSVLAPKSLLIVGDVDRDGVQDVALANSLMSTLADNPDGMLGTVGIVSVAVSGELWARHGETIGGFYGRDLVRIGDVDLDGAPDLATSASPIDGDGRVQVLSGRNGRVLRDVTFERSLELRVELDPMGDLDGDGFAELLAQGRVVSVAAERVLDLGPGRPTAEPDEGHFAWAARVGDRTVAGYVDGSGEHTAGFLDVGMWTPLERFPTIDPHWTKAASGDFDGDGLPDLLLAENGGWARSPSCTIRIFPGRDLR